MSPLGLKYATEEAWRRATNSPRQNEVAEPKREGHSTMDCPAMKAKFDAAKSSIAQKPGVLVHESR